MITARIQHLLCAAGLTWKKTLFLISLGVLAGLVLTLTIRLPVS